MKMVFIYESVSPDQKRKIRSMVDRRIGRLKRRGKTCRQRRAFLVLEVRPVDDNQVKWEANGRIELATGQISASSIPSNQPIDAAASAIDGLEQELRTELLTHPKIGRARQPRKDNDQNHVGLEIEDALSDERSRKVGNILASARENLLTEANRALTKESRNKRRDRKWVQADDLVNEILLRAWPEVEAGLEGTTLERRLHQLLKTTIDDEVRRSTMTSSLPTDPHDEDDRMPIIPGDDGWLSQPHRR